MNALKLAGLGVPVQFVSWLSSTTKPDQILEEIETYFLHRQTVDKWAHHLQCVLLNGVKFFFTNVLKQDFHLFTYMKAKHEKKLPCILSREEINRIRSYTSTHHNYAYFYTFIPVGSGFLRVCIS